MTDTFAHDVAAFHVKFGVNYDGPPRELPADIQLAREARTLEELHEWMVARSNHDLPKQLDAMIDLIYFALGNLHLQGFSPEAINTAWDRVHAANMAKVRSSDLNPGKHAAIGTFVDIAKPVGWVTPNLDDLCGLTDPPTTLGEVQLPQPTPKYRYFYKPSDVYLRRVPADGSGNDELSGNIPNDWTPGSCTISYWGTERIDSELTVEQAKELFPLATYE